MTYFLSTLQAPDRPHSPTRDLPKAAEPPVAIVQFGRRAEVGTSGLPQIAGQRRSKMNTVIPMQSDYVEKRSGGYYVAGSRVSLASIVYEYRDGATPETIRENFPTLSLEQIHGAIAFYLGHQEQVAANLRELETKWSCMDSAAKPADPELQHKIEEARKRLLAKQA